MKQELIDYIRHLSKQDRKSLSEKVLKTGEEFGELAKVALPYTQAYATNHRFIKREQILEEAVDTILCSLSVAYDLDFTDAEVNDMIALKCKKWQSLQAAEQDIIYPLPYEIHITVKAGGSEEWFKKVCEGAQIKPVFIDNQFKSGKIERDVLTSYTHYGNNATAYNKMRELSDYLKSDGGFDIVRDKIETVPWHPAAPCKTGDIMPKDCYFEAHIGVIDTNHFLLKHDITNWNNVWRDKHQLSLSNNPYKAKEDGTVVTWITFRETTLLYPNFESMVQSILDMLEHHGWKIDKVHKEFAVYDSNVSHDAAWLKG